MSDRRYLLYHWGDRSRPAKRPSTWGNHLLEPRGLVYASLSKSVSYRRLILFPPCEAGRLRTLWRFKLPVAQFLAISARKRGTQLCMVVSAIFLATSFVSASFLKEVWQL